ncbi:hypothetical protein pqer_cds_1143 [Pandoravirus quercus]|uniref:Uncharacterized protein n=2 Tax=Pandoravirus TaxID=2060084 RepID=A0A2U7UB07_9VIRU|nr:hypothetical protein pqer_cds_1143 [Pandoravirus quercus]AVK75565.1 hypothetical protein pqer_cds_1143 [Pandoravirus quercus]QBZ81740.1 hypothetical protein pclt_cds_1158 [Pandoravirus celtis]
MATATMETTPARQDSFASTHPDTVAASAVAPHLFIVEIQGIGCRTLSVKGLSGLFYRVAGAMVGSASLVSMQTMGRHPWYCGATDNGVPCQCDDTCTVLCVGTMPHGGGGVWAAVDMAASAPGKRKTRFSGGHRLMGILCVQPSMAGCFSRHACITEHGVVVRNEAAAGDCPTCAHTWSGFQVILARAPPRERANAARLAAITTQYLDARPPSTDVGVINVMCMCIQGMRVAAGMVPAGDARMTRVERAVAALGTQVDGLFAVCLWARRLDVSRAVRIVVDADMQVGVVLPDRLLPLALTSLDSVVNMAVTAAVIVARANRAAADVICDTPTLDADIVAKSVSATAGMCAGMMNAPESCGLNEAAQLAARVFAQARKEAAEFPTSDPKQDAADPATTSLSATETEGAPKRRVRPVATDSDNDSISQRHPQHDERNDEASTGALRCAGAHCRAPKRRIVSGCAISVQCTAGCQTTLHRACWEAVGIALVDAAPCPTPDCWGEIARVTSTRLRAVGRPPRVLWEAAAHNGKLPKATNVLDDDSAAQVHPPTHREGPDGSQDTHDNPIGDADDPNDAQACFTRDLRKHNLTTVTHDGNDIGDEDHCCGADTSTPTPPPPTGGMVYQKASASRDTLPIRRKRPRNRAGKRQRRRLIERQQHQALMALPDPAEPLIETPPSEVDATGPPAQTDYADDALWPSFFVATADGGSA